MGQTIIQRGGGGGGGGGGAVQTISYGGIWDGTSRLLLANGRANSPDQADTANRVSRHGLVAGTIEKMTFHHFGDLSTNNATIKIVVNGSVVKTLTASGGTNTVDLFTSIAVSVSAEDFVAVEFDAGSTNPGESLVDLIIE